MSGFFFSFPYVTPLIRIEHPQRIYQWKAYEIIQIMVKCLLIFGLKTNASIIIQTVYFTSRRQCGCQFQFQPLLVCLCVSAPFALLFRAGDF